MKFGGLGARTESRPNFGKGVMNISTSKQFFTLFAARMIYMWSVQI